MKSCGVKSILNLMIMIIPININGSIHLGFRPIKKIRCIQVESELARTSTAHLDYNISGLVNRSQSESHFL